MWGGVGSGLRVRGLPSGTPAGGRGEADACTSSSCTDADAGEADECSDSYCREQCSAAGHPGGLCDEGDCVCFYD
jgi:hypothetical protein